MFARREDKEQEVQEYINAKCCWVISKRIWDEEGSREEEHLNISKRMLQRAVTPSKLLCFIPNDSTVSYAALNRNLLLPPFFTSEEDAYKILHHPGHLPFSGYLSKGYRS